MAKTETTRGYLLNGRLSFRQPAKGYRTGIDPVLLAAAVPARDGDRIFELGVGAGAAALCLLARVPGCTVTGEEIDPIAAALAVDNSTANGLAKRLIMRSSSPQIQDGPPERGFDHLMSNPPFWRATSGNRSPYPSKASAHHEGEIGIDKWMRDLCRRGGRRATVTAIYPAARVTDLVTALSPLAGDLSLFPLWPKERRQAKRVLVQAHLGSMGPARLLPGMVLHSEDGRYTKEAEAVLREGKGIDLGA
ncbi:MAG: methyltransferase [Rhodospirillaceae bacterium]|nr:methyltransferase [Rhodospirillaceae bacterium]MCY4311911.1 methyltransferase [Rhodospirillaceae bacterium]